MMEKIWETREIFEQQLRDFPKERIHQGEIRVGRLLADNQRIEEALAQGRPDIAAQLVRKQAMHFRAALIQMDDPDGEVKCVPT